MRAAVIVDGAIVVQERLDPVPEGRQVLVRVRAAGVNRADLLQRAGRYPAPPGVPDDVPGLEFAGVVEGLGPTATMWEPGDRVMGLVGGGAHAELLVIEDDQLLAVPDGMDLTDAAAVPEVFVTAHDAAVTQANLRSGETLLVHAVGSGVGTAAVQLATALGARAVGTTRTASKLDRVRPLGLAAGAVIGDPSDRDEQRRVRKELGTADVVLDLVGGDYLGLDLAVAAPRARIVVVGLLAGARTQVDLGALLSSRASVTGTVLRSRPAHEKAAVVAAFAAQVVPLLADGRLVPVVEDVMAFDDVAAAYDRLGDDGVVGKLVLDLDSSEQVGRTG